MVEDIIREGGVLLLYANCAFYIYRKESAMIYMNDNNFTQRLMIPKPFATDLRAFVLELESSINHTVQRVNVTDISDNPLYYYFDVVLEDGSPRGEYIYRVLQEGEPVTEGILIVELEESQTKANDEMIEIKQYDEN